MSVRGGLVWGGLALLALVCTVCVGLAVVVEVPNPLVLAVTAVAALVPAVGYTLVILLLDQYEQEPWPLLVGTFFWGAIIASGLALLINTSFQLVVSIFTGEALASV